MAVLVKSRTRFKLAMITWDIVDILPDQARTGCDEGLFEMLPDEHSS